VYTIYSGNVRIRTL